MSYLFNEFARNDIVVQSGYLQPTRAQALLSVSITAMRGGDKEVRREQAALPGLPVAGAVSSAVHHVSSSGTMDCDLASSPGLITIIMKYC